MKALWSISRTSVESVLVNCWNLVLHDESEVRIIDRTASGETWFGSPPVDTLSIIWHRCGSVYALAGRSAVIS